MIGTVLNNRYRVDQFLGRGGMAEVYKVWDQKKNVYLAVKILHADLAEDKIFLRRFKREATTLSELQHPHIVRFYGLEKHGDQSFLVMDYIPGTTLRKRIFKLDAPMPDGSILQILKPLCAALQFAHTEGKVHCDLKPANIMISDYGTVLLMDFGIVRMADASTATLVGAGTPAYMAPEQAQGQDPTAQTDIYALGVILYEMLTAGERPYTGENATVTGSTNIRILWEQMNLDPPSPRKFNPDINPELENVVMKCLQKDPAERYASVIDVLHDVQQAMGFPVEQHTPAPKAAEPTEQPDPELPDPLMDLKLTVPETDIQTDVLETADDQFIRQAEPVGLPVPPPKKRSNKWFGFAFAGGLGIILLFGAVVLIGGGILLFINSGGAQPTEDSAAISLSGNDPLEQTPASTQHPADTQTAEPADLAPGAGATPTRTTAPSPTVTRTPAPSRTATSIPTATELLPDLNAEVEGMIVFTCQIFLDEERDQICVINVDGSGWRRISTEDNTHYFYASFAPDNQTIIYSRKSSDTYQIYEMDLYGNETRISWLSGDHYAPAISPDGQQIAFTYNDGVTQQGWVMNRDGSNPEQLMAGSVDSWDPAWSPDGSMILFASDMGGNVQLYTTSKTGNGLNQLTSLTNLRGRSDWSVFDQIATYQGPSWEREIVVLDLEGGATQTITNGGNNLAPSYSPDGNWITFTSYMDRYNDWNGCEIYIMRIDGSDIMRLTDNAYCDWQPRWSH